MQDPQKHHFLPVFYLKNWCGSDNKLTEFSVPYQQVVKYKRKHPQGTGYISRLYAIEGLSGEVSQDIEKAFLSPVDSRAAEALKELLRHGDAASQNRLAWAKFVFTLIMRMPNEIALLKGVIGRLEVQVGNSVFEMLLRHIPEVARADFEEAIKDIRQSQLKRSVERIRSFLSLDDFSDRILDMKWAVINFDGCPVELMTSDRPVSISRNAQTDDNTVFAIPISPRNLFVCSDGQAPIQKLESVNRSDLAMAMNIETVAGARKFAYASSASALDFVGEYFGRNIEPSISERVLTKSMSDMAQLSQVLSALDDDAFRDQIADAIAFAQSRSKESANTPAA